jgi:hypothetical protein
MPIHSSKHGFRFSSQMHCARLAVLRQDESVLGVPVVKDLDTSVAEVEASPVKSDDLAEPCARLHREARDERIHRLVRTVRGQQAFELGVLERSLTALWRLEPEALDERGDGIAVEVPARLRLPPRNRLTAAAIATAATAGF